jgi:DNA-directed RNA polymerase specialized sigma24 family protein
VVRLHWISGYKYQEISELLEVKLNTVRTRIHRGMATMQQCLCSGYQDLFSGNCS